MAQLKCKVGDIVRFKYERSITDTEGNTVIKGNVYVVTRVADEGESIIVHTDGPSCRPWTTYNFETIEGELTDLEKIIYNIP